MSATKPAPASVHVREIQYLNWYRQDLAVEYYWLATVGRLTIKPSRLFELYSAILLVGQCDLGVRISCWALRSLALQWVKVVKWLAS